MKTILLYCAVLVFLLFFVASMSGCGTSGVLPTPPTPPTPSETSKLFAFLRNDGTTSSVAAANLRQQIQADRRTAKITHANRKAAITVDSAPVNIYVWGFGPGSERKITATAGAFTAVQLSRNGTSIVFSATVNGYNQIFTNTVPAAGQFAATPLQLTTDLEHHWVPHISADGSEVVFTKADPNSTGDVVCLINNAAGAIENCLDFSSSTPVLKGADLWHASWTSDGKIVFEAWGGPLNSDDIFMVNADGSGLTQITNNAGTKNYDECTWVNSAGTEIVFDTWNDTTQYYEIAGINLSTKQRFTLTSGTQADAWDPLSTPGGVVYATKLDTDKSLELYLFGFGRVRLTNNTYADYFESSTK